MFRSRHTIAIWIIALYFIPILFLSFYGMNAMTAGKSWSFFSFGLFFGLTGTLILFSLMIRYETSLDEFQEETEIAPDLQFTEETENLADFDTIIVNLNEDLKQKLQEVQTLASENFNLRHRVEMLEQKISNQTLEEVEDENEEEQELNLLRKESEKAKEIDYLHMNQALQNKVPDISALEQNLYTQNKIEVTRL